MKTYLYNILMIGPLPPPIGGGAVLFQNLVNNADLSSMARITTINSAGVRGSRFFAVFRYLNLVYRIYRSSQHQDVITLHCATSGLPWIGPPVMLIAKFRKVPFIVRKFGGTDFFCFPFIRRKLSEVTARSSDIFFVETKGLMSIARKRRINADWMPNSRPMKASKDSKVMAKMKDLGRFVYVGQIKRSKGVIELIHAVRCNPGQICLDIFGPLGFDIEEHELEGVSNVRYKGILSPDSVVDVLKEYDALVLPTKHHGEGYPGVILEAYAAGIPVICTNWRFIPEIVDEASGILISTPDPKKIKDAMLRMINDPDLYQRLKEGVLEKQNLFDSDHWDEYFYVRCRGLLCYY